MAEPPPIRLVGRNVIPNSEAYYPAHDRRLGREGTAEVQACVNPEGTLSSTPTVERSSGRAAFDHAAVRLVGDGRFAKAMRGDEPVPNCYRFRGELHGAVSVSRSVNAFRMGWQDGDAPMQHHHAQRFDARVFAPGFHTGSRIRAHWQAPSGQPAGIYWRADIVPRARSWVRALTASATACVSSP